MVHIGIVKVLGFGKTQHFLALGIGEEFTVVIEKFKGIPLLGVVRCRDDDASACVLTDDCQFGRGRGGEADVDHVKAHAHERSNHRVEHHASRQACITPDDDDV